MPKKHFNEDDIQAPFEASQPVNDITYLDIVIMSAVGMNDSYGFWVNDKFLVPGRCDPYVTCTLSGASEPSIVTPPIDSRTDSTVEASWRHYARIEYKSKQSMYFNVVDTEENDIIGKAELLGSDVKPGEYSLPLTNKAGRQGTLKISIVTTPDRVVHPQELLMMIQGAKRLKNSFGEMFGGWQPSAYVVCKAVGKDLGFRTYTHTPSLAPRWNHPSVLKFKRFDMSDSLEFEVWDDRTDRKQERVLLGKAYIQATDISKGTIHLGLVDENGQVLEERSKLIIKVFALPKLLSQYIRVNETAMREQNPDRSTLAPASPEETQFEGPPEEEPMQGKLGIERSIRAPQQQDVGAGAKYQVPNIGDTAATGVVSREKQLETLVLQQEMVLAKMQEELKSLRSQVQTGGVKEAANESRVVLPAYTVPGAPTSQMKPGLAPAMGGYIANTPDMPMARGLPMGTAAHPNMQGLVPDSNTCNVEMLMKMQGLAPEVTGYMAGAQQMQMASNLLMSGAAGQKMQGMSPEMSAYIANTPAMQRAKGLPMSNASTMSTIGAEPAGPLQGFAPEMVAGMAGAPELPGHSCCLAGSQEMAMPMGSLSLSNTSTMDANTIGHLQDLTTKPGRGMETTINPNRQDPSFSFSMQPTASAQGFESHGPETRTRLFGSLPHS